MSRIKTSAFRGAVTVVGLSAVAAIAACGSAPAAATSPNGGAQNGASGAAQKAVTIDAREFAFTPSTVNLKVGQPVTMTVVNQGTTDHDLKSDIPLTGLVYTNADNPADEQQENVSGNVLDVDYDNGHTATVTFTPTKAGTYMFHCDVAGHTEAGMIGRFVVS